jgi:hypothetical protein
MDVYGGEFISSYLRRVGAKRAGTVPLLQCDTTGTLLQTYQLADNRTILSRYMLQESLILYTFLPLRPNVGDPPFFQAP